MRCYYEANRTGAMASEGIESNKDAWTYGGKELFIMRD